jgi:hypothetical protein
MLKEISNIIITPGIMNLLSKRGTTRDLKFEIALGRLNLIIIPIKCSTITVTAVNTQLILSGRQGILIYTKKKYCGEINLYPVNMDIILNAC